MNIYNSAELLLSDENRYRLLIDSITDYAIYMLDRAGGVTSWNAGARRFMGYEAYEAVGMNFSAFYSEQDREAGVPARVLETAAREGRFESEGWRVRKSGEHFWANAIVEAIRGPAGEVVGFAKVTRDLTERKVAHDALKASEEQFRRLVQGVTDYAIFMLNANGKVSSWNAGAERIKGYSEKEILGKHFSQFYTEEDRQSGVPKTALETAEREGRWEKEGWRLRKDGTQFFGHVVIDAIRDEDGKLIGFAKVTRDITERMQAQQALEKAQRELFQSQKLGSLGQLTGGVAHDFNNLLTAIVNNLELAQSKIKEPGTRNLISNSVHAAERGTALTQRMLAFAQRQELTVEPIDVARLLNSMSGLIERTIGPRITVHLRLAEGLPPVLADENQLESAVMNLAINARDAMPNGGVLEIAVVARKLATENMLEPPGDYLCLTVTDSGFGMDEITLSKAVEPFFTTKGPGKGTGLGLSMVQGLIEQLGGRVILKSKVGQGTEVSLLLPVTDRAVRIIDVAEKPESNAASACNRVLLVDDDDLVRRSVRSLLEDSGYIVSDAESGAVALQLAAKTDFDLLVTDHMMPGISGTELIDAIREIQPMLPALIITGYVGSRAPLPSATSRLMKPFKFQELKAAIRDLLQP